MIKRKTDIFHEEIPNHTSEIFNYLIRFGSITPIEALKEIGCMRLASRISDLKKIGIPIKRKMVNFVTKMGRKSAYAEYYL